MSATRTLTLADVAAPRAGLWSDALWIVGASVVTALAAQIAIPLPWTPVPITGQTFAVLLSGAVLGSRRGAMAQALYLAEGAIGLPVFAGASSGAAPFAGPTGGYLLAFPLAAAVVGALCERGFDRRFGTMFLAMLLGSAVIFSVGLALLARFVPAGALLAQGLLPFVPGDLVKSALAAALFPAAWRLVRARTGA
jgi:biotin transport system substrate-specific component